MDMRGALARGTMATAAMMTGKSTDATPPAGLHLPHPFMCILGRPQEPMQQDLSLLLEAAQCFHIMAARRGCCKLRHGRHKADREVCHGASGTSVVCKVTKNPTEANCNSVGSQLAGMALLEMTRWVSAGMAKMLSKAGRQSGSKYI